MSRDKQIEEMAAIVSGALYEWANEPNEEDFCPVYVAKALYREEYRKASDVAREIFKEIDESFSQMLEEAENTIADTIQEENRNIARIAQHGRDVLILAHNTLGKILKTKYESEGAE